jgi:hypothetical protein
MRQQVYADPHGLDAWDQSISSRCFVTLVDAVQWREITGETPPTKPPTAADYTKAGLPWFDYYAWSRPFACPLAGERDQRRCVICGNFR